MTGWASYSYVFGPLVALLGLAVVILLLRRTFRSNRSGLTEEDVLAPLLGPHTWADVNRVADRLRRAGIRHRVADLGGGYQVLVPADDLAAARAAMYHDT